MFRSRLLMWLVAASLLGLFGVYVISHLEWERVARTQAMSGEARRNPYHAGLLMMEALGYPTRQLEDTGQLTGLSPQTTLLLNHNKSLDKQTQARLLAWVRSGGHLVLNLGFERNPALLAELGIRTVGEVFDLSDSDPADSPEIAAAKRRRIKRNYPLKIEGDELRVGLNIFKVFQRDGELEWSADLQVWPFLTEDEDEDDATDAKNKAKAPAERTLVTKTSDADTEPETAFAFGRFALGQGHVTVGKLDILNNRQIHEFDHARLFVHLLSLPEGIRPIALLPAPKSPDLLTWLFRHAPEAMFGVLMLMLASLWHFAPRFGPLRPDPIPARPGLREHLTACGHFLLQAKAYEPLITPLREEVSRSLTHLRNRHPELETLPELGAKLSGLAAAEIERALSPNPDSQHEFLRRCQTLALLRDHCNRMRQAASAPGNLP